jgi:choice-of-anchor A domain-containing protein
MYRFFRFALIGSLFVDVASATVVGPISGTGWDASAFNIVTLTGNLSSNTDIGGRIAVYGNLTNSGSPIGNSLDGNNYTENFSAIINGNVSPNVQVDNGKAYVGGTGSGNVTDSAGVVSTGLDFDFAAARTALDNYSANVLTTAAGQVNFTAAPVPDSNHGNGCDVNIASPSTAGPVYVNLNAQYLSSACNGLYVTYNTSKVTAIVFNVAGTSINVSSNYNLYVSTNGGSSFSAITNTGSGGNDFGPNPFLFNFYQATTVNSATVFDSSILAPLAALTVNGDLLGQAFVASVASVGETHDDYFNGTGLPSTALTSTPEPMTFALLGGGLLMIGTLRKRFRK